MRLSRRAPSPDGINPGCPSRLERAASWIGVLIVLAFLPWPLLALYVLGPGIGLGWLLGSAAAAALAGIAIQSVASKRSREKVAAADYCLCPECRYPLGTLPPTGS